jgi:hypothetical protein
MADGGRAERRRGGEERHERLEIAEQCETERASSRRVWSAARSSWLWMLLGSCERLEGDEIRFLFFKKIVRLH